MSNMKCKHPHTQPPNSTAQQHFHKSLPPTLFLCSETFSLAWCFVNICCLKQEHASWVAAYVRESLGKSYSGAENTQNVQSIVLYSIAFPLRDLIDHVTRAVYLDAKCIQNTQLVYFHNG